MTMETQKQTKPATDSEIREILGTSSNDDIVMAVRKTGATYEEVLQAFEWLADDDYMGKKTKKPASGTVGQLCDLLQEELDKED
jgi:hypothetical protein